MTSTWISSFGLLVAVVCVISAQNYGSGPFYNNYATNTQGYNNPGYGNTGYNTGNANTDCNSNFDQFMNQLNPQQNSGQSCTSQCGNQGMLDSSACLMRCMVYGAQQSFSPIANSIRPNC